MLKSLIPGKKPTASEIAVRVAALKNEHTAAVNALVAAKKKRASLPFDASEEEAEAINNEIRGLEDTIAAKASQIEDGDRRRISVLVDEYSRAQPGVWNEAKKELLEVDRLAREIARVWRRAVELDAQLHEMQGTMHLAGRKDMTLRRPMGLALARHYGGLTNSVIGSVAHDQRNHALTEMTQSKVIPVGVDYEKSPIAQFFETLRALKIEDANGGKAAAA